MKWPTFREQAITTSSYLSRAILDLIYPPRCGGCERRGTWFCDDCLGSITPSRADGARHRFLDDIISVGRFEGPLRSAIHKFKYQSDRPLATPLGRLLADRVAKELPEPGGVSLSPTLVPVPLHATRRRERGYNQAELLTREVAARLGLPVSTGLVRGRATRSQVGLSAAMRRANIEAAFEWRAGVVPEQVILVDDVCTTGATLEACAEVLVRAGAQKVTGAVLAMAEPHSDHPSQLRDFSAWT